MKLSARLKRLEAAALRCGGCYVVTFSLDEDPSEALARARASGVRGGVLFVGEVLPPEVWTPLARVQQEALLRSIEDA